MFPPRVTGFFLLCGLEDSARDEEPYRSGLVLSPPRRRSSTEEVQVKDRKDSTLSSPHVHGVAGVGGSPALLGCWREGVGHSLIFRVEMTSWLLQSIG